VVTQVSLSLLLLVGAGLFVRTLTNLENVNLGFNQNNLLLFGIDSTQDGYKGRRLADFYQELAQRLELLPEVRSVSMSWNTLIAGGLTINGVSIQGYTPKPGQKDDQLETHVNQVGPKFFETVGIPLLLGRTIGEGDTDGAPKVAVVNENFVRQYLGTDKPVGRRFGFGEKKASSEIEIVGVVGDAKYNDLRKDAPPTVYVPSLQDLKSLGPTHFEVRTAGDPMQMASALRKVAKDLDPNLALFEVRSEVDQIEMALFQERLFARLTSFFGLLAALLGCVGVYGIMAFSTTARTREIGIRMALGAARGKILGMVLRETLVLVAIGIAIGILAAVAASRLIATLLYRLRPTDPLTIAVAGLLMVIAAALAGYIPARRASRVDPTVALRYE